MTSVLVFTRDLRVADNPALSAAIAGTGSQPQTDAGDLVYAGNLRAARLTGPYRAWRAIGTRLSLADQGLTFA